MSNRQIVKAKSVSIKEAAQYSLSFGLLAAVLFVIGFPMFWLVVVLLLGLFLWRSFLSETRQGIRPIFEFLLSADEILRNDGRIWYGFELKEAIARGEAIVGSLVAPPPLLEFALGALLERSGDSARAVKYLESVLGCDGYKELAIVHPSEELREYVRFLRKIERSPSEAPIAAAAIRSLERMRRIRGAELLAKSRAELAERNAGEPENLSDALGSLEAKSSYDENFGNGEQSLWKESSSQTVGKFVSDAPMSPGDSEKPVTKSTAAKANDPRKSISELLHDIYDSNPK